MERYFEILLVEDNPGDVLLIEECLRRVLGRTRLLVARDTGAAKKILEDDIGRARPDLVLLDLHVPPMTGFDFLEWIRATPALASLRVVVLTCSDSEADAARCRSLGVTEYALKASDLDDLRRVAGIIESHLEPHPTAT